MSNINSIISISISNIGFSIQSIILKQHYNYAHTSGAKQCWDKINEQCLYTETHKETQE